MGHDITSTVATVHGELLFPAAGQRCQLVVIEGPDMGRAASIGDDELLVGTDEDCQLVLHDDRVSRRHLSLRATPEGFVVRDLDSRNGTLYAGSALGEATVPVGATLKLGRTFLRVQPRPEAVEVVPSQSRRFGELVAESLAMREVFAVLELAAQSEITVLLEGETGTGKELAARALHEASDRRRGPFVAIDCGALPESLLESELFGHVRGAFTGAASDRRGAFLRASAGTIFLDELDGVSLAVQARLLRVVEERRVRPVGGDVELPVDVRVVAAARSSLPARVAEGSFRPDLFYRLSVVRVVLPPLRQRREDIAPIVVELLRRRGFDAERVAGPNLDRLYAHDWPGNVRELRNVIERALALAPRSRTFDELRLVVAPGGRADGSTDPLTVRTDLPYVEAKQQLLEAFEQRYLQDVLARCEGNISATARASGLDRKHLKTLLRRHGLLVE
jgi:transcriptional regulator with PAS, ATPase and Fis domain